jgi:hypothetical protein
MKNQKYLTSFLVLLFITSVAQTVGAQRFPKRDLGRYENGGDLDFNWEVAAKHEEMRGKLREFLWEHWSKKQLGVVVATFYSYHGDYTTHTFFVEPDAEGRWRVVSEYEGECCVLDAMQKKRKLERKKGTEFYDLVERVAEESRDGKVTWQVISAQDRREADKYRLRLRRSQAGKLSEGPFLL